MNDVHPVLVILVCVFLLLGLFFVYVCIASVFDDIIEQARAKKQRVRIRQQTYEQLDHDSWRAEKRLRHIRAQEKWDRDFAQIEGHPLVLVPALTTDEATKRYVDYVSLPGILHKNEFIWDRKRHTYVRREN